ncbi:DMT family transporter [Alteromonas sp. CYL-A6]|uniref:DMT family transporter n=1 Tax=Alteromonas nitratireducens TaxID=3390813 RepID=UPI0034C33C04
MTIFSRSTAPAWRLFLFTALTMLAFAANSLLCRFALRETAITPAAFTSLRLASGAVTLLILAGLLRLPLFRSGSLAGAACLFVYAAGFSFAYVSMSAGIGALLLFGSVQLMMIGAGFVRGERLSLAQISGVMLAIAGLVLLLMPGLTTPPLTAALLMVIAGVAWGGYSLLGARGGGLASTADNFIYTLPLTVALLLLSGGDMGALPADGVLFAVLSGSLASGLGYALWYFVLPAYTSTQAASLQLNVPVITVFAGAVLLSETLTVQVILASAAIVGGIALVIRYR